MCVEILAYSSSDWRAISPKEATVQAHAQWRAELLAATKIISLLSLPMFFPCSPRVFFFAPQTQF